MEEFAKTMNSMPIFLVTANVGSIFEQPTEMLKLWIDEFLSKIASLDAKFIALHCQEVGGKKYEKSMQHVEKFIDFLLTSPELAQFSKMRIFLDEDYTSVEHFTALGNLYFIHNSVRDARIWNFQKSEFQPVENIQKFSGNIEGIDTIEKAKFPQHFFPECKWSRKGFMRTRWSLMGTIFDLVNIHLFHDESNLVSMSTYPSIYCRNRQRALEHTLYKFHNDPLENVPYFLFGDFNFRADNEGVIRTLTKGLTKTRVQNTKNNDQTTLHYYNNDEEKLILSVGKKEFNHNEHEKLFLNYEWLKKFDKEIDAFTNILAEYLIQFPPTYPFEEKITKGNKYMPTRCPAWCDRILFSHSAEKIIDSEKMHDYGLLSINTCMGDHKPVFLRISLKTNAGIHKCCDHALFVCLPDTCRCCKNFASYTINVVDMSDYLNNSNNRSSSSSSGINNVNNKIDSTLLHDRHLNDENEPYTPESSNSRTPLMEDEIDDNQDEEASRRSSVSPTELKSKLENIIITNINHNNKEEYPLIVEDNLQDLELNLDTDDVVVVVDKKKRSSSLKCCSIA